MVRYIACLKEMKGGINVPCADEGLENMDGGRWKRYYAYLLVEMCKEMHGYLMDDGRENTICEGEIMCHGNSVWFHSMSLSIVKATNIIVHVICNPLAGHCKTTRGKM